MFTSSLSNEGENVNGGNIFLLALQAGSKKNLAMVRSSRSSAPAYHHGDLKQALLTTSLGIIQKEGVAGFTLQKAAREQGVSAAAVYRHYESKEALLATIAAEGFVLLRDRLDMALAVRPRDARALFRRGVEAYIDLAISRPNHYELMFGGVIADRASYPELVQAGEDAFQRLLEIVRVCQQAGLFKRRKTIVMAFHVWSLMHGFVMLHISGQNPFPVKKPEQLRRLVGLMVQFLRRGLDLEHRSDARRH
ncbi:MAG: TetR/AcrR family transcriptional regulator [Spirochaetales bacterium]|nr:TetR/AcrR family transcriptional regulator [Leptospiraceae bacterium]MCP5482672.1 TetR/AcrR family transcriptional regulator [Spirochaetales bacterium]MCP5485054.1 TetR/AcrR family transcriptional regulator [Spirochaetales bacterium]